ncbi:MAG: hypothetical protein BA863_16085 [Desulfovibrio sp. S3730MH75]|nr:MAG: hypothetical protein BA863_16085 [Desulfovibrio sp. S3730MH75]
MPSAQIIQLNRYRQPPTPQPLSKKDQIKQLLDEATPISPNPVVIEIRPVANEKLLTEVLVRLSPFIIELHSHEIPHECFGDRKLFMDW